MYHLLPKEFLENEFPILNTDCQAIINFVSCDGIMGYKLGLRLKALYPKMHESYIKACIHDKTFDKGKVLIWTKSLPWVINIPVKETWKQEDNIEFIEEGIKKLSLVCEKMKISSIAIQKNYINDEYLDHCIKQNELPEIKYYEENI